MTLRMGRQVFAQALRTLRGYRLQALLTLGGIAFGTSSLILLLAWGEGVHRMLTDAVEKTGRNIIYASSGFVGETYSPLRNRRVLRLTREDVEALRERAHLPLLVSAVNPSWTVASADGRSLVVDVRATEPEGQVIQGLRVADGRLLEPGDVHHRRRVAVVGASVRRELLGLSGAVGSRLLLNGRPYRVVGVLERVGNELYPHRSSIDEQVLVPISAPPGADLGERLTFAGQLEEVQLPDLDPVRYIQAKARSSQAYEATRREIRAILADRLDVDVSDPEALHVRSPAIELLREIPFDALKILLFIIAAMLLVIAGIGVTNMMLESVQERTREIGTRLALGAERRDVVMQFFLETLLVSALGGAAGLSLGLGACAALAAFETPDLIPVPIVGLRSVVATIAVTASICVASGVAPALRASRVDPSETLRSL